jgi:hypothetical protein
MILSTTSSLLLALACTVLYFLVQAIYRLFFHPLSKFPGPKLAAITFLYEFYCDVIKGGQFLFQMEKMHDKYGRLYFISSYRSSHIEQAQSSGSILVNYTSETPRSTTRSMQEEPTNATKTLTPPLCLVLPCHPPPRSAMTTTDSAGAL